MMVYLILSFFVCFEIQAGEWWKLPRTEDKEFLYYVGSAEGKASFTSLHEEAFGKAMSEIVREHFGVTVQVSENAVQDLSGDSYQVITKQNSSPIAMKGISVMHTYETEQKGRRRIYLQLRVNKKELSKAVANYSALSPQAQFNTYGDPHGKTSLKIKTNPSGALITLTHHDQRYAIQGQGDAHFYVPQGKYHMVVSAPGYMAVTREIHILAEGREEEVKLEELHTRLQLNIEPEDARVFFNGKEVESSAFKLPIGRVHKFRFTHPDYLSQEIEVATQVPEVVVKNVNLEPKMSTLRFSIEPGNATVEIDGKEVSLVDGKVLVTPGRKHIRITKKNYYQHSEVMEVAPNREYPPRFIYLKLDTENTSPSELGPTVRLEYNPFSLQGQQGRFHLIPIALHFEWYYISIGGGIMHTTETETEKDKYNNSTEISKDYMDSFGTVRLISPKMNNVKLFASYTMGNIHQSKKRDLQKVERSSKSYQGFGGGARFYFTRAFSFHMEYFRTETEFKSHKVDSLKKDEDRIVTGFSYEF